MSPWVCIEDKDYSSTRCDVAAHSSCSNKSVFRAQIVQTFIPYIKRGQAYFLIGKCVVAITM